MVVYFSVVQAVAEMAYTHQLVAQQLQGGGPGLHSLCGQPHKYQHK